MKNLALRYKILGFLIILIMTLTVLTSTYHSNRMKKLALNSVKDVQTKYTQQLALYMMEPLDYDLTDEVERIIVKSRKENPEIKYIQVFNREGVSVSQFGNAGKVDILDLFKEGKKELFSRKVKESEFLVEYFYPIKINGLVRFYLRVCYDNTKYGDHINEIIMDYIKIIYGVVILILILGYFFFKHILFYPLEELLVEMKEARKEFSTELGDEIRSGDEINYLRNYFNHLISNVRSKSLLLKDLNTNLEKKVEERTEELRGAQAKLLESAHMAGMATMAAGVLHNIGNILTLASNTAENIRRLVVDSNVKHFSRVKDYISSKEEGAFNDESKKVFRAYDELVKQMESENADLVKQVEVLTQANRTMLKTVQSQQKYAKVGNFLIEVRIDEVIKDSIQLLSESLGRHRINIHYQQEHVRPIQANKANLLNVFVNLLLNAKESILQSPDINNPMSVDIVISENEEGEIKIRYTDTGIGMNQETLNNLFQFGYTTKDKGSGFGLHDAANTIKELGGEISAYSEGLNKGATIEILIPTD